MLFDLVRCRCLSGPCFLQGMYSQGLDSDWYYGSRPGLFVTSEGTPAPLQTEMNTAQKFNFSVVNVTVVNSVYGSGEVFASGVGWPTISASDGMLRFETALGTAGDFLLTVEMRDSGGTALGGVDAVQHNIALQVLPRLRVPALLSPDGAGALLALTQAGANPAVHRFPALLAKYEPWSRGDRLRGPPPLVYEIVWVSNPFLFVPSGPSVDPDGSLAFALAPFASGNTTLSVRLVALNATGGILGAGPQLNLTLVVLPANLPPRFMLAERIDVVETAEGAASGPRAVMGSVWGITAGSPEEDATQELSFTVTLAPSPVAVSAGNGLLWLDPPPRIEEDGTLVLWSAFGQHGEAILQVSAKDNGPASSGGPLSTPVATTILRIWPRPRVLSVTPQLAPLEGGGRLTVRGAFFGSLYSRGVLPPPTGGYRNVSVAVGQAACEAVSVASDAELACDLPMGRGLGEVQVTISDGALTRSGALAKAVRYSEIFVGGWEGGTARRGLVASSPAIAAVGDLSASVGQPYFNAGIRAIANVGGALFVGGSFTAASTSAGGRSAPLGYVAVWDGSTARALEGGVDGDVYALVPWAGPNGDGFGVLVGGAFSTAFPAAGPALRCGGLAWWNMSGPSPSSGAGGWELAGAAVDGPVWTIDVVSTQGAAWWESDGSLAVLIGGAFDAVGGVSGFGGLARYSGGLWLPVGVGLSGRVSAVAAGSGGDSVAVYVAGDLRLAAGAGGAVAARGGAAAFDGEYWTLLPALDGPVNALVAVGGTLLAAGGFRRATAQPPAALGLGGVARLYGGVWADVGGGLSGTVMTLAAVGGCLYAGGPGQLARLCQLDGGAGIGGGGGRVWEALQGSGLIGVVRTLAPALAAPPIAAAAALQCGASDQGSCGA